MSNQPKHQFNHPKGPEYKRPWCLFQNPKVREEIAQLDAKKDCQRIVFLLKAYEFPSDLTHALEMGLYHTYGSRTVAKLLDYTQEFENFGQKRYDDTYILIAQFMEAGWDNELGARALKQVAKAHSRFAIKNDDYLFVLWTFIEFPIQWMRKYGWRKFTPHEEKAWYAYWLKIGEHMGIQSLPREKEIFASFVEDYEKNTRDIINNLDLKWEDGIKSYKNIDKPVTTASLHQVRGKILKNTSDQWKQYQENLSKVQTLLKSKNINF